MADEGNNGTTDADFVGAFHVNRSDRLDANVADEYMSLIIERAIQAGHPGHDAGVRHIRAGVYHTGIVKGGSSRDPYLGMVTTPSGSFPAQIIAVVLGNQLRRFYRTYADRLRRFLQVQRNERWVKENTARWGVGEDHYDLAFDSYTACSDLSTEVQNFMSAATKGRMTSSELPSDNFVGGTLRDNSGGGGQGGVVGTPVGGVQHLF